MILYDIPFFGPVYGRGMTLTHCIGIIGVFIIINAITIIKLEKNFFLIIFSILPIGPPQFNNNNYYS